MINTFHLSVNISTNSYKPVILLEQTDSEGDVLESLGDSNFIIGNITANYKKNTREIEFYSTSGKSISLGQDQISSYSIFGTTDSLNSTYAIWKAIYDGFDNGL